MLDVKTGQQLWSHGGDLILLLLLLPPAGGGGGVLSEWGSRVNLGVHLGPCSHQRAYWPTTCAIFRG